LEAKKETISMTAAGSGSIGPGGSPASRIPDAIGGSEAFLRFQERLSRAAKVDRPVLLLGERGTGKELAARRLHYLSGRWEGPLVTLNCAALAPTLIESELFGHEAGAFTGAVRQRSGRFEQADEGTLFLDEVGNIPMQAQEKILRVVEYGNFERVGGARSVDVDVRIVGASNVNLAELAEAGDFKPDLLDRLSFEVLFLPPLRERTGDILLLANHFASRMAHELGWRDLPELGDDAAASLERYDWPGNVRELKNVVERAVYRTDSPLIREIVFNPFREFPDTGGGKTPEERAVQSAEAPGEGAPSPGEVEITRLGAQEPAPRVRSFRQAVEQFEISILRDALLRARFSQKRAARSLGLTYDQFRGLYKKYKTDI